MINAQLDDYPKAMRLNIAVDAALNRGTEPWADLLGDHATLQLSGVFKAAICTSTR